MAFNSRTAVRRSKFAAAGPRSVCAFVPAVVARRSFFLDPVRLGAVDAGVQQLEARDASSYNESGGNDLPRPGPITTEYAPDRGVPWRNRRQNHRSRCVTARRGAHASLSECATARTAAHEDAHRRVKETPRVSKGNNNVQTMAHRSVTTLPTNQSSSHRSVTFGKF